METLLTIAPIKKGAEETAREWMAWLGKHIEDGNETLRAEGEHLESWFLEESAEGMTAYCYTLVEDTDRQQETYRNSENPLDKRHEQYMRACLDWKRCRTIHATVPLGDYSVFR